MYHLNARIESAAALTRVKRAFEDAQIPVISLEPKSFPHETIIIVTVEPQYAAAAMGVANLCDKILGELEFDGFVTVKTVSDDQQGAFRGLHKGVRDDRASALANLLAARSRTSESQPSLSYVPDAMQSIKAVLSPRHHLIFGRRGAGKTALMVESKRLLDADAKVTVWVNIQPLRRNTVEEIVLYVCKATCEAILTHLSSSPRVSLEKSARQLLSQVEQALVSPAAAGDNAQQVIPKMNELLRQYTKDARSPLYIFVDELHYLRPKSKQPEFLDALHALVRDANAWLKIAGIKHLSKWWDAETTTGLETGHDAVHINLDVTLEDPGKAKSFLETVLARYAEQEGIRSVTTILSPPALDRLVLASGAVPRDYLVLTAKSILQAQQRPKSLHVGIQDVTSAAGEQAKFKVGELEDDAAAGNEAATILSALDIIRKFCLDEKRTTFFRVDFRDKEQNGRQYLLMQQLMDLRLLHLVHPSLSDEREAGRRSEVFMLDLSQFSGQRFKKHLKVLDLSNGTIVLKETGKAEIEKVGDKPNKLLGIFRRGPLFPLSRLSQEQSEAASN